MESTNKLSWVALRKAIAKQTNVSEEDAGKFLIAFIEQATKALEKGESVRVNTIGTFRIVKVAPRKSINVTTGETIILNGYNKVSFLPETTLKTRVNNETPTPILTPASDPLRKLSMQADEIIDILAELGQHPNDPSVTSPLQEETETIAIEEETPLEIKNVEATATAEPKEVEEEATAEPKEVEEEASAEPKEVEEEASAEPKEVEEEATKEPKEVEEEATKEPKEVEEEATAEPKEGEEEATAKIEDKSSFTDLINGMKKDTQSIPLHDTQETEKPKRPWLIVGSVMVGICVALTIGGIFLHDKVGLWLLQIQEEHNPSTIEEEMIEKGIQEETNEPNVLIADTITHASEPQKDTLSTKNNEPSPLDTMKESLPQTTNTIEENKENSSYYEGYIGTEVVSSGSRLAWIAKKYYGEKRFWVFIYHANKDRIANPSNVEKGTILRIPKLKKEYRDYSDPKTQQIVNQLQKELTEQ